MGLRGKLYTTGDIADRLGVTRQRAYQLSRRKDFPEPLDDWPNGLTVWEVKVVDPWIKDYLRKHRAGAAEGDAP